MICSRLFVCWAIAVCLAACLCESAETVVKPAEQRKQTEKAVRYLQTLTEEVVNNATRLRNHAEFLMARANTNKQNAKDAISLVSKVPEDNEKALQTANKLKETSQDVIAMYKNARESANESFQSMRTLVTEAIELDKEANNDTWTPLKSSPPYETIKKHLEQIKAKVETFQAKVKQEKEKILQPAIQQEINMSNLVQTIKVGKYNFSVILSVTKIDTALEKAEIDIDKTKKKMEEVTNTLNEIRDMSTKKNKSPTAKVNKVIEDTESAFVTATKAVGNAEKLKGEMMEIKTKAYASLEKFTDTTKPEKVVGEVRKTEKYVDEVKTKTREIAIALQSAESAAESAKSAKQYILNLLTPGNTQQSGEIINDSEVLLKSATDTFQHSLSVNPRMNSLKRTVIGTSENPLKQKSDTLTVGKGQQPNVNDLNIPKDQLTKGTHSGKNIPSVNGKDSAGGASGDGSMILSVPLLAALIASAVLH